MKVIETSQDFSDFARNCKESNIIVIPIPADHTVHSEEYIITGIYISTLNNMQNYYISVNHSESIKNFTLEEIIGVIDTPNKKYVHDIKEIPSILQLKNIECCNSLSYFYYGKKIEHTYTPAHNKLYSIYWNRKNINTIIPIYKHIEYCQELEKKMLAIISNKSISSKGYIQLKNYLKNLKRIESVGLYTSDKNLEHCNYNPYTLTGRPSNTFNKVNYAALNKTDGTRNRYISRFNKGGILELDYDAHHLRIISDIIGYKLPETSIHEYLGKQYFGKDKLSKKEYNESKEISFRILYGGIPKEFLSIPFFNKVNDFIFKFWEEWQLKNYYETYLYKRKVHESVIGEMSPQKLFNYYIQSAETELNSQAMERVFKVLDGFTSKFILYTYDSFTFDFNLEDEKSLILQIKNAMKYPTRISFGSNYGDLKDVSLQFS
tara:strand:- start:2521 stop:3822 length:1302 start_codon:yes stop_codon:yes gene_type:complete